MRRPTRSRKNQVSMYVDDHSVQVVVLHGNDIVYHGEELLADGVVLSGDIIDVSALGDAMGRAVSQSKAKTRRVKLAWAPARTLYKTIPMPAHTGKNIRSALMIDAEQQLQPIDPSLLHIHVFQRPEDVNGASVIAYDKKQLGRIIEAANIGRVKVDELYHPAFGLLAVSGQALCYLGPRGSYYAEGEATPRSIRAIHPNHPTPSLTTLLAEGVGDDTDWIDDIAQDILLTRDRNRKLTGIDTELVAFAGPLLAVRGMARYLAKMLTGVKLGTIKLPYNWPEGTVKETKAHYHATASVFAAVATTNIITEEASFSKSDDETVVAGGVRIIEDERSSKWLIGLAGTAVLVLAMAFGAQLGIQRLAERVDNQAAEYNRKTAEVSTKGEARVLGSQDWIDKEKQVHGVWDQNAVIRENLADVTTLKGLFEAVGLRVNAVNVDADKILVEYTGDSALVEKALTGSAWSLKSNSRGAAEIVARAEAEEAVGEQAQDQQVAAGGELL